MACDAVRFGERVRLRRLGNYSHCAVQMSRCLNNLEAVLSVELPSWPGSMRARSTHCACSSPFSLPHDYGEWEWWRHRGSLLAWHVSGMKLKIPHDECELLRKSHIPRDVLKVPLSGTLSGMKFGIGIHGKIRRLLSLCSFQYVVQNTKYCCKQHVLPAKNNTRARI